MVIQTTHYKFSRHAPVAIRLLLASTTALLISACGGGGSGSSGTNNNSTPSSNSGSSLSGETVASATSSPTDNLVQISVDLSTRSAGIAHCADPDDAIRFTASAGFQFDVAVQSTAMRDLLNHARCLAGVPALDQDASLDAAALNHANYSLLNKSATHTELSNLPGFTASNPGERMSLSGFAAISAQKPEPAQWGEVLSKTGPLARESYDGLLSAIYHRLAMLSPQVNKVGVGLKTSGDLKEMVAVVDMAASSNQALGQLVIFPAAGQQQVPTSFNSDLELPDPFPAHGVVGYPISVQADRGSVLTVSKFELRDANGDLVPSFVRARTANSSIGIEADAQLENNETFLSAVNRLNDNSEYQVRFEGTLDGQMITKSWSFRTAPAQAMAVAESNQVAQNNYTRIRLNGCSSSYNWRYTNGLDVKVFSNSWMQVRGVSKGAQWAEITDSCGVTQRIDFQVN